MDFKIFMHQIYCFLIPWLISIKVPPTPPAPPLMLKYASIVNVENSLL